MFVRPGLVEVERLWIPHTPPGGVVGDIDQVVAVVVDIACMQGGQGERGEGREERGEREEEGERREERERGRTLSSKNVGKTNTPYVMVKAICVISMAFTHDTSKERV